MFKSMSYNTANGSFMNESSCSASFNFARLSMDTVVAVSIFVILALIGSIIVLAELSVIVLAVLSAVIIAVAAVIIERKPMGRPNVVKA